MDSGIKNNTVLKTCAKEGILSTTLWLMRETNLYDGTTCVMNSYRIKVDRIIKEEKRLAKHRQEKQGSDKYHIFLEETFKYPLSSSKAERSSEVKPSVSKLTESVVGELSTKLVDAEVHIGLEKERKEALESEVYVLKRKQEALESSCQEKNVKLKRLRSSEHYQIEKNKKLEKQQSKKPSQSYLGHAEVTGLKKRIIDIENEMLKDQIQQLKSDTVEVFNYSENRYTVMIACRSVCISY